MKALLVLSSVLFIQTCYAQTITHAVFTGGNIASYNFGQKIKTPRVDLSFGYEIDVKISEKLALSTGFEYRRLNTTFERAFFCAGPCFTEYTTVTERIQLNRLVTPVGIKFHFGRKEKKVWNLFAGADIMLLNRAGRSSDYNIPATSITGTYEGKQRLGFKESSDVGVGFRAGVGRAFLLKKSALEVNLFVLSDISKNKLFTLQNIEDDNYYFTRILGLQLRFAYVFPY